MSAGRAGWELQQAMQVAASNTKGKCRAIHDLWILIILPPQHHGPTLCQDPKTISSPIVKKLVELSLGRDLVRVLSEWPSSTFRFGTLAVQTNSYAKHVWKNVPALPRLVYITRYAHSLK